MKQVTIRWGTEGNEEKTYIFNNEHDLKMFMKGVNEANGWLEYYIVEEKEMQPERVNRKIIWKETVA
jgi:hypothetical protein